MQMRKPIVLYVEDEENDVFFMQMAFEKTGMNWLLQSVPDGPKAIAYLAGAGPYADRERHPLPSVVLLDLNLPGCSGFEVLQWLREQPQFQQLPAVIFSSSGRQEDRDKAQALGANGYIEKPVSGLAFPAVVHELRRRCE
jgi:CheY-like chemotaxis protein